MPLDAGILDSRIPLAAGASVPKINTPAENMAIVADAENARTIADSNRLKLQEQQQAMADQQAMQRVMQEAGGDWEVALPRLRTVAPGAAAALEEQLTKTRKERALALKGEAELDTLKMERALAKMRTIRTPEQYAAKVSELRAMHEDLADLPDAFDPDLLARYQQAAPMALDAAKLNAQAAALYAEGKPQEAMSRALLAAMDQEDVDHALAAGQEMGLTRAQIALFPRDFAAPNFRARVEQFAMSADQRADNAARDVKQAADIAHQQATEAIARGQLGVAQGNLAMRRQEAAQGGGSGGGGNKAGSDVAVLADAFMRGDESVLAGLTPSDSTKLRAEILRRGGKLPAGVGAADSKPSTMAEKNAFGFFARAQQADENVESVEDEIAKLGLLGQVRLNRAPNFAQTTTNQKYRQAQRAFTEARLRKESGAAIAESEYEHDAEIYFAQPGDSKEVLDQKRRARAQVIAGLAMQSGRALRENYGDEADTLVTTYRTRAKKDGGSTPSAAPQQASGGSGGGAVKRFNPKTGQLETVR